MDKIDKIAFLDKLTTAKNILKLIGTSFQCTTASDCRYRFTKSCTTYYLIFRLQCRIAGRTSSLAWRSRLRTATTLSTLPLPMAAREGLMGAGCFPTPIGWRQFSGSRDTLPSSDTRDSDKTPAKTSGWTSAQTKSTQWDGAPQKENHSYHQRVRSQVWILKNDLNLKRSICPSFLASLFLQLSKQSKTTGRISLSKD